MILAMIQATKPPAKPIPSPTAAQMAARCRLCDMIPSAAPRNNPHEAHPPGEHPVSAANLK